MLVLNANQEQKQFFNKLIQELGAQVVWNGRFVVMGDRLVLEGFVQSLYFHLDIQKMEVQFVDLETDDERVTAIDEHPELEELLAMTVYAFAKWGELKAVQVEQDLAQLDRIFGEIMGTYGLEIVFSEEKLEFYQAGMRITFEDVIEKALYFEGVKIADKKLPLPVIRTQKADAASGSSEAAQRIEKYHARIGVLDRLSELQRKALERDIRNDKLLSEQEKEELYFPIRDYERQEKLQSADVTRDSRAVEDRIEKYIARIGVLDRLSSLQKKALARDIRTDQLLNDNEKERLLYPIQDYEYQEKIKQIDEELKSKENKTYAHLQKMIERVEKEDLLEQTKQAVLEKLGDFRMEFGRQEVGAIMAQTPAHVERSEYEELIRKLEPYGDIDMAGYRGQINEMRKTLEIKEISNMLMQSPRKDRSDYTKLLRDIEERDFDEKTAAPYVDQIMDRISEFDEARLKKLLENVKTMDYKTAASVYKLMHEQSFLPKLRTDALAAVSRRLEELSLNECMGLVQALKKLMSGAVKENPRHHFYPAEKILKKTVQTGDFKLIQDAVSSYAEKRGKFEHPILMVDTSKEGNGRDGMLLTPEHLFYSTRLSGYRIPTASIKSIYISSGLLKNKTLTAEDTAGIKHKIPYVVEADELKNWARILDNFVKYLNGNKVHKAAEYESEKAQGAFCCRRCGCVYHDAAACPECGYRKNG